MTTHTPSAAATVIPPAPARWKLCDIDALLRVGDYAALDQRLDDALAASFQDRDEEERYYGALPDDLAGCTADGAEGLARLAAWQAARPQSAHAWLCEAHYWYHWAYEYRGSGWASTVTALGWECAHACATRCAVAALRALTLAPTMWTACALLLQSTSAFNEPDWLTELVRSGRWPDKPLQHDFSLDDDAATRDELLAQLARSGLANDERIACPEAAPTALPSPVQGRKVISGTSYWIHATLHVHPRLFFFMRQCVWFQQPRWGGSHERVRAFIASPACAHLSEVEKDRLRHEIWRDDYQGNSVDKDEDPAEAQQRMAATRQRAQEALYPYHRWETLRWLAVSHYMLDQHAEALACLREAESHHPIDDDYAMNMAVHVALEQDPGGHWLGQAICNSANAYECNTALILHGYCSLKGAFGFVPNAATGNAWLAAARERNAGTENWDDLARALWRVPRNKEAFEILEMGLAAGDKSCLLTLGIFHAGGEHGTKDRQQAMHCYGQAAEAGNSVAAYKLGYLCHDMAWEDATPAAQRPALQAQAVEAMLKARELGHDDATEGALMFISDLSDIPVRHRHLDFVREHATNGDAIAMATLSTLLADANDKVLYNYRESVRWIMGAQAVAPEDEFVVNVTKNTHQDGFLSSTLYKLTRRQIKAHEIPGGDNAMV